MWTLSGGGSDKIKQVINGINYPPHYNLQRHQDSKGRINWGEGVQTPCWSFIVPLKCVFFFLRCSVSGWGHGACLTSSFRMDVLLLSPGGNRPKTDLSRLFYVWVISPFENFFLIFILVDHQSLPPTHKCLCVNQWCVRKRRREAKCARIENRGTESQLLLWRHQEARSGLCWWVNEWISKFWTIHTDCDWSVINHFPAKIETHYKNFYSGKKKSEFSWICVLVLWRGTLFSTSSARFLSALNINLWLNVNNSASRTQGCLI